MLRLVKNTGTQLTTTHAQQVDGGVRKAKADLRLVRPADASKKKTTRRPAKPKAEQVGPASAEELKALARKLILDHVAQGLSMRERIEIANKENYRLFGESSIISNYMGVVLGTGGRSIGMDCEVLVTVIEPKALFRYFPELRKPAKALGVDLTGLAVY